MALGFSLLPRGLGRGRDFAGKKGEKGLLLVGHEKVPRGSGLTGDRNSALVDGAEPRGYVNHGLLLLFRRYSTLDRAKRRRKDCVHLWVI